MTLIVENGTGLANAESYASVAYADAYFAARNVTTWTGDAAHKEGLLRIATEYIDSVFGQRFKGTRNTITQALQWPRDGVSVDGFDLDSDVIPVDLMRATCEIAHQANSTELLPNLEQGVIREKVDVLEVEYDSSSPRIVRLSKVNAMLAKYLTGNGFTFEINRT